MKKILKEQIFEFIDSTKKNGTTFERISEIFNYNVNKLINILDDFLKDGLIFQKGKFFFSAKSFSLIKAKITKNFDKFCFAKALDMNFDIFIPAKFSKNALFDDVVLVSELPSKFVNKPAKNLSKEGQVVAFCERKNKKFTGVIIEKNGSFFVKSDDKFESLMEIIINKSKFIINGCKVLAKIDRINFDFRRPTCKIIKIYGDSNKAYNCFEAYIQNNEIPLNFSDKILKEASKLSVNTKKNYNELDLTKSVIFTIDSKTSKDLDDAVSIKKINENYLVGVHIADVSNYVTFKSNLDKEALKRGTSIYIANKVIPMLVPALSNDICSLQPKKVRLTFSVFIELNSKAEIIDFYFKKTKIKSSVKGIYEEINQILSNSYKNDVTKRKLLKKYDKVRDQINIMLELTEKLKNKKVERGCPQLQSTECKISLNNDNFVTNITKKKQGVAEDIIEELMLLANECVASFAKKNNLPIFFRIHESPPIEKIENLKKLLKNLGFNSQQIKPNMKPKILANLLKQAKNSKIFTLINNTILKTMAKAKYDINPLGHYGLALENYTHFTSPIRRYCDLMTHRILSEFLFEHKSSTQLKKKYRKFLTNSTKTINDSERLAIKIERHCENYFKAEFMLNKIGQKFKATICSCNKNGMFVQLDNTIEGFVKIETLDGNYFFDDFCKLICANKNKFYQIGQQIEVICTFVNVNSRIIDFEVCE